MSGNEAGYAVGDRVRLRPETAGSWKRAALDRAAETGRTGTVTLVPSRVGAPIHVALDPVRGGHKALDARVGRDALEALPPVGPCA